MPDDAWKDEQIDYYRQRAAEYDEWFLRLGRYDRGEEHRSRWNAEVERVREALERFGPRGDVLELAGGTGLWTELLAPHADRLTVLDASPEMLAINRARLADASKPVEYREVDLFEWEPAHRYDTIFFGFWLSHVPPEHFEAFWDRVARALLPGGRVFFVDSLFTAGSTAGDHDIDREATIQKRRLNDGSEHRVVKVYYEPEALAARLASLGWEAEVAGSGEYFLLGEARRPAERKA